MIVNAYSNAWPVLFPQHGPGRKHLRPIILEPWQKSIVEQLPQRSGLFVHESFGGHSAAFSVGVRTCRSASAARESRRSLDRSARRRREAGRPLLRRPSQRHPGASDQLILGHLVLSCPLCWPSS
ncbi:MAG: hypothetical protein DME04_17370 [Candidatus Rokuibacteriota bacterium]|nr:MAG: hypothetical protein DME04_17370 [Candidatus Rokubacteria bacterium]